MKVRAILSRLDLVVILSRQWLIIRGEVVIEKQNRIEFKKGLNNCE